ncbi:glutamate receptor ionotropic, kainate 2-like isoform X2 [Nylanderia fulva]|uniref:glutamate receptor ionotropic, kainate 2-like isoform X2 n=1 Tax=Nylanderia fulva TaxID=613905 RepID=UPI0010FBBD07|nr:glutamate receptor ionotropic, kainate 2-like isoform X2 [Nylanderia fulva]XP_029165095.1 glutamate receptor ionotropic, kainate 2-like isoform X2 [Nylanderia fulva]XP_029165096.1 glutamate receptor ionotropic, kainate 2-like isoform X2 [Nylanderia fulva]XP_029165097.1 glutamate receptor ionotropic, kainate 2-like isoform X2 [Nylanderia fulva]
MSILPRCVRFSKKIHIAGLFDQDDVIQRMFDSSVKAVNRERHENEELSNVYLVSEANEIDTDLYEVSTKVCELLDMGIVGIFGPQEKVTAEYVQSICDTMEIPHISVREDPSELSEPRGLSLNLYPHVSSLSRIYDQLVTEFKWKSFAILYENTDSLIRLHLLLKRWDPHGNSAFVYHLGSGPNYRRAMQEIKASEIENIIIDCSYDILSDVLTQAQQVGILSDKNQVIVTSLDLQTLDLKPYQYSGVNFTGLRLIDPEDLIVQRTLDKHKNEWGLDDPSKLRVEFALMYDAVQLFARAFKQLKDAIKGDVKKLPCDGSARWEHGLSLSNFMRLTETRGLSGFVKFDRDGLRSNIQLDVVRLTESGLVKIGVWNSTAGNKIDWIPETGTKKKNFDTDLSLQNKTFIILISLTHPYGMQKESSTILSGNDRYEGFGVDIIERISKILGFNYTLQVEAQTGSENPITGKWSGMLGKLMNDEADMAISDLTITSERESVVDFTNPFMNLGISILYQKPRKTPPSLFSFLSPFSSDVWIYLIGAYIIVSLLFFIIGRLCPAEWNNPYPCIEEAEELENQFTFKNAFWFAIGAIMQQGSEIAPIGISTRMMAGCWWFFCLIMVSSYTANLAAFLTVETVVSPFDNVEELAKKKGAIKYGAKRKGSTLFFFRDSDYPLYKEMYKYMTENEAEVLPEFNDVAINKVKMENYAFLMESSSIEYTVERECNVTQVGGLLDEKGYGIAMKKHSPYRHHFNTALLKLSESGIITELKKKWWQEKRGGGKCHENGGGGSADELGLDNVGGVFVVLSVGAVLSCVYTIFELLWDVARTSIRENVVFKEELINEVKFILKCSSSKPTRRRNGTSSKSENNSTRECTPPYGFIPTVITTSPTDDK